MSGTNGLDRKRVGIIGVGRIVERAHLPVLCGMADVEVVGLFDQDEARARTVSHQFSIPRVCRSLDELFDLKPDVTLVACPNRLHSSMSIAALEAGTHVLCEKPIATSVEEAEAMIRTAERNRRSLMVGSTNRFRPEVEALQKAILDGKLGEIQAIRCGWLRHKGIPGIGTWFTNRTQAGGGVLTDLGSHLLDLAIWLGGRRRLISAQCIVDRNIENFEQAVWYTPTDSTCRADFDVEVSATGFAVYEGPLNIFIEVSWASAVPHDQTYLQVMGTRGIARLETLFGLSPNGNRPDQPLQLWSEGSPAPEPVRGSSDVLQPYKREWRFFIDSLGNGCSLTPSLYDGLAMMQLIEEMYRSAEQIKSSGALMAS